MCMSVSVHMVCMHCVRVYVCICALHVCVCADGSPTGLDLGFLPQALASVPANRLPRCPRRAKHFSRQVFESLHGHCVPGSVDAHCSHGGRVSVVISRDRALRKPLSRAPEGLCVFFLRGHIFILYFLKKGSRKHFLDESVILIRPIDIL